MCYFVHIELEELTCFPCMYTGDNGYLEYDKLSMKGSTVFDLVHTEVPLAHRGQGLAGLLTHAALEYADSAGVKVRLTCTYVQHYVSKHSEYSHLVVK